MFNSVCYVAGFALVAALVGFCVATSMRSFLFLIERHVAATLLSLARQRLLIAVVVALGLPSSGCKLFGVVGVVLWLLVPVALAYDAANDVAALTSINNSASADIRIDVILCVVIFIVALALGIVGIVCGKRRIGSNNPENGSNNRAAKVFCLFVFSS